MNIPEGFVLVPASMLLDKEVIELVACHCGDGDQMFGDYTDGRLWVGDLEGDDGEKTHGLHIMTEEYPEEGSSTLIEFPRAELPSYDEDNERQIFEDSMIFASEEAGYGEPDLYRLSDGSYRQEFHEAAWGGWQACAKSRARSAE